MYIFVGSQLKLVFFRSIKYYISSFLYMKFVQSYEFNFYISFFLFLLLGLSECFMGILKQGYIVSLWYILIELYVILMVDFSVLIFFRYMYMQFD